MPVLDVDAAAALQNSAYGQVMPKDLDFSLEPQLVPIHLQFNYLLRDEIPLHQEHTPEGRPNEVAKSHQSHDGDKNIEDEVLPPTVLTKGYFDRSLDAPSHVVLNHVNCMEKNSPYYVSVAPTV